MAREAERPSTDQLERLFELSLDMLGTACDGFFTQLNPAWQRTLGWTSAELMDEPYMTFVHPEDVDSTVAVARRLGQPGGAEVVGFENRYRASDGSYRWVEWTTVSHDGSSYFVAKDVTSRRAAAADIAVASSLARSITDSVADGLYVADGAGKITLINPAAVRMLGFDSDAELLGLEPHPTFHHSYAEGTPYPLDDCPLPKVRITGRPVRVEDDTFWRKDGSALAVAYSSAPIDLADGTGSVVAFRDMTEHRDRALQVRRALEALSWVGRLRDALTDDRLVLYAQPIVAIASGETIQHELLVRMIATTGEIISPPAFLPAAETHGLMGEVDRRVFALALTHAAAGHRVAVNLSAASISEPGLFGFIEEQMALRGADPAMLTFEVTETALIDDEGVAQVFIENIRRLGCDVALDDFGSGYGSFRYLKRLPVTHLKIDQEFVRDLDGASVVVNRHVIQAIVTLARGMGLKTVAEGVETETALAQLQDLGVDYAQGHLFARAAPAADVLPTPIKAS